jgi:hypothetical protein
MPARSTPLSYAVSPSLRVAVAPGSAPLIATIMFGVTNAPPLILTFGVTNAPPLIVTFDVTNAPPLIVMRPIGFVVSFVALLILILVFFFVV